MKKIILIFLLFHNSISYSSIYSCFSNASYQALDTMFFSKTIMSDEIKRTLATLFLTSIPSEIKKILFLTSIFSISALYFHRKMIRNIENKHQMKS